MSSTDNPAQCLEVGKLLIDTRTTAAAMSISERTLFSITEPRGTLRCLRLPGRTMYRPADVTAWLDEQQRNPIPPKVGKPIVRKEKKRGGRRSAQKRAEG